MCRKQSIKKSAEFIFDESEEKIEGKNIKNSQVDIENQREYEAISNNIYERMEVSEVFTDSWCSEERLEINASIFDIFGEIGILDKLQIDILINSECQWKMLALEVFIKKHQ